VNTLGLICREANARHLSFLVVGGHAVIVHGHGRNTFDLDLAIRRADQSAWMALAKSLGYTIHREGPAFVQFTPPSAETLPLDLMLLNDSTFAKLHAESLPASPSTSGARVVSLLHLLALKCHAIKHGHAGRIVKDADDVIRLVEVNGLDVTQPELKELLLKHGPKDLYEKLRRLSTR
jgi:hypothetical protein